MTLAARNRLHADAPGYHRLARWRFIVASCFSGQRETSTGQACGIFSQSAAVTVSDEHERSTGQAGGIQSFDTPVTPTEGVNVPPAHAG